MSDIPISDCLRQANALIALDAIVYQKFTCTSCGNRLTIDVPNTFYFTGTCDRCGALSDIKECGFMVVLGGGGLRPPKEP